MDNPAAAPDVAALAQNLLADLLAEWEACAEVGWNRWLTTDEARVLLAELDQLRQERDEDE